MREILRIRGIKIAAKHLVLGLHPATYWRFRVWRRGWPEPELLLLPRLCRRDRAMIDVGANYGMYTQFAARHSAHTHAFEPLPQLAALLRRGYDRERVTVHEVALSDRSGTAELRSPKDAIGTSTIEGDNALAATRSDDGDLGTFTVPVEPLDAFAIEAGLLKIDVEGHEEAVLRGAEQTLARWAPTVIVEAEDRHKPGAVAGVARLLEGHGYRAFFLRAGAIEDFAGFDVARDQNLDDPERYVRNFVYVKPDGVRELRAAYP